MNEELASIHKQYLLADRMKLHVLDAADLQMQFAHGNRFKRFFIRLFHSRFGARWERSLFSGVKNDENLTLLLLQSSLLYLTIFYGLVYTTVEAWIDAKLRDEKVDQLLRDPGKLEKLKRFRNATFHVQKDFISEKHLAFLEQAETESWIKELHRSIGAALERHPDIAPFFKKGADWAKGA